MSEFWGGGEGEIAYSDWRVVSVLTMEGSGEHISRVNGCSRALHEFENKKYHALQLPRQPQISN